MCAHQCWVRAAAAVFILTARIDRTIWKYTHAHAYRVMLLDAGHLGQTFHLVCTALQVSPWTTAAVDEVATEDLLGIDGTSEVSLYAGACGMVAASGTG